MKKLVDGQLLDLTPAEQAEYDARHSDVAARKLARQDELAALRYAKEVGGITLGGQSVATDRQTVAQLTSAWSLAQQNPSVTIEWKRENGWFTHTAATLAATLGAVGAHVEACFANEKAHWLAIEALTDVAAIDAYDISTGWPT